MRFHRSVVHQFGEMRAGVGGHPLPRHAAVQRQHVHLHPVLVHPRNALIQIRIHLQRTVNAGRRTPQLYQRFRIRVRNPMGMRVN